MIGVEYDLFWTLNPKSLQPFIKAFNLKKNYDNSLCWQQGAYIRLAIASALNKSAKYPNKPFGINELEDTRMSAEEIKRKMMLKMHEINAGFRKGG